MYQCIIRARPRNLNKSVFGTWRGASKRPGQPGEGQLRSRQRSRNHACVNMLCRGGSRIPGLKLSTHGRAAFDHANHRALGWLLWKIIWGKFRWGPRPPGGGMQISLQGIKAVPCHWGCPPTPGAKCRKLLLNVIFQNWIFQNWICGSKHFSKTCFFFNIGFLKNLIF